jgi:hypothetical protein
MSRVAQLVQCLAIGWTTGRSRFDPRQGRKDFSSSLCVQTGSGVHPASCTMGNGGHFPGAIARPESDADHVNDELESMWSEVVLIWFKVLSRNTHGETE